MFYPHVVNTGVCELLGEGIISRNYLIVDCKSIRI